MKIWKRWLCQQRGHKMARLRGYEWTNFRICNCCGEQGWEV